jgi:hypothetical protein
MSQLFCRTDKKGFAFFIIGESVGSKCPAGGFASLPGMFPV